MRCQWSGAVGDTELLVKPESCSGLGRGWVRPCNAVPQMDRDISVDKEEVGQDTAAGRSAVEQVPWVTRGTMVAQQHDFVRCGESARIAPNGMARVAQ